MYKYNEIKNAYKDAFKNMDDDGINVLKSSAYFRYLQICKNEKRGYNRYDYKTTDKENT